MPQIKQVALDTIDFKNRDYVFRHVHDVGDLENSIQYEGMIHPPVVQEKASGKHLIVAGSLRLLAAKNLQKDKVACLVYQEKELEKEEFLKIAIAENTKRQNLRPVEIAEALARIREELSLSDEELAEQFGETFGIGKTPEQIRKYLELNALDSKTKDFFATAPVKDMEFTVAGVKDQGDRDALIALVEQHRDIKKNQLGKIIENAQKVAESDPKAGFKSVFEQGSIKEILDNHEMAGSKKINTFLAELERMADPERLAKQEEFDRLHDQLDAALTQHDPGFVKKVAVRKPVFGDPSLKITLTIESSKDFGDLVKILYDLRKSVLEPMIRM